MNLPSEWIERAEVFLNDARKHLSEGNYWLTCFEAQQAVELYLKAFLIKLTSIYLFTRDLVELLNTIASPGYSIPDQLYVYADALTPHYTMARYPGRKPVTYDQGLARRCIMYAEEIIKWVKEKAV